MAMTRQAVLVLACLVLSLWRCAWGEDGYYTNSWAVEVAGGRAVADDVARRHGFLNMGQVSAHWEGCIHRASAMAKTFFAKLLVYLM